MERKKGLLCKLLIILVFVVCLYHWHYTRLPGLYNHDHLKGKDDSRPAYDTKQSTFKSYTNHDVKRGSDSPLFLKDSVQEQKESKPPQVTPQTEVISPLPEDFSFPHQFVFRPIKEIEEQSWYHNLYSVRETQFVYLVFSNTAYEEVLLNWLSSAVANSGVDLNKILVIVFSQNVYDLLTSKEIRCVLVHYSDILEIVIATKAPEFSRIMLVRLAITRILTYWGVDVLNLDTDALLVRDPEPLFNNYKDSGIVGSLGMFPPEIIQEWGFALCAGAVLIRSSPKTEDFWIRMSRIMPKTLSDQQRLNYALKHLGIKWEHHDPQVSSPVHGTCDNGLKVTVLPMDRICRSKHCITANKDSYTIWHKGGSKHSGSKIWNAKRGGLWFLTKDWKRECSSRGVGKDWLNCVTGK